MANPSVEFAESNGVVESTAVIPDDPLFPQQWGLPRIRADEAWIIGRGSTNSLIAVVDTGTDYNHIDLREKVIKGKNFAYGTSDPLDDNGHGTHVAGIAAASTNNDKVIAGTSWYNKILAVKVLNRQGTGTSLSVAKGILYLVNKGAKIINLSLGGPSSSFQWLAVIYADWRNRLVVGAAGNDDTSKQSYPAAYSSVLAVGATDQNDGKSPFSNFGNWVDIAAPGGDGSWGGGDILSTLPTYYVRLNEPPYNRNRYYDHMPGTSMATPFVSGAAAVLWAKHPTWSDEQVRERLERTAKDIGQALGHGRIDLFDALFNGSFETGDLSEWNVSGTMGTGNLSQTWSSTGTVTVVSNLGLILPTKGKYMAMVSTGPDSPQVSSTLTKSFAVLPGTTSLTIRMDYNFVTEEYPEWVGTIYDDYFQAKVVTSTGQEIPLAFESVNSSSFIPYFYQWYPVWKIDFYGGDQTVFMTGWKHVIYDISGLTGTGVTLKFHTWDKGDSIYDTAALIDNVKIE